MQGNSLVGQVIDERFTILSPLAEGGYGAVYLARQVGVERTVVIKFLHAQQLSNENSVKRFEREAKLIAGFNHPNIVSCFSYGLAGGKLPYLVFEHLEGQTLREQISCGTRMKWDAVCTLGQAICAGLAQAHDAGIVHRDIKPENIFITTSGGVKILDFGVAFAGDQRLTAEGAILGTMSYISPEAASGQQPSIQSDIYSLGCVLYECLSGEVPLQCDSAVGLLLMHASQYPALLHETQKLPRVTDQVLFKAMHKNPAERYADARAFAADLQLASGGHRSDLGVRAPEKLRMTHVGLDEKTGSVSVVSTARIARSPLLLVALTLLTIGVLGTCFSQQVFREPVLAAAAINSCLGSTSERRIAHLEYWGDVLKQNGQNQAAAAVYENAISRDLHLSFADQVHRARLLRKFLQTVPPNVYQDDQMNDLLEPFLVFIGHDFQQVNDRGTASDLFTTVDLASSRWSGNRALINRAYLCTRMMLQYNNMNPETVQIETKRQKLEGATNLGFLLGVVLTVIDLDCKQDYGLLVDFLETQARSAKTKFSADKLLYESLCKMADASRSRKTLAAKDRQPLIQFLSPWLNSPNRSAIERRAILSFALETAVGHARPDMVMVFFQPRPEENDDLHMKPYLAVLKGMQYHFRDGDNAKAVDCYISAMRSLSRDNADRRLTYGIANLACAAMTVREKFSPAQYDEQAKELMTLYKQIKFLDGQVALLWVDINDAVDAGRLKEALRLSEMSVKMTESAKQSASYYFARAQHVTVLSTLNRNNESLAVLLRAYKTANDEHVPDLFSYPILGRYAQYLLGKNDPACIPLLERVVAIDQSFGSRMGLAKSLDAARIRFGDKHQ